MAVKGMVGEQLAVIPLIVDRNGESSLYTMNVPDSLENVRKVLDAHGLPYRTLDIESGPGIRVIIFDPGSSSAEAINRFAHHYNIRVDRYRGHGEYFPENAASREEAGDMFREFIARYERSHPDDPRWHGSSVWRPPEPGDQPPDRTVGD
jgi:hypothetical protein